MKASAPTEKARQQEIPAILWQDFDACLVKPLPGKSWWVV
jgi:hypothetical protein